MSAPPGAATIGARVEAAGTRFRVWAPAAARADVLLYGAPGEAPGAPPAAHPLAPAGGGYFEALVPGVGDGARYTYRLDGGADYPDPASRSQPEGVHAASEVVDPGAFRWTDAAWPGLPPDDLVLYELHVGTFTPEGTFDAAAGRLDHVVSLGATAVEVMPVASFAGARNWGYDGVALFAPAAPYGGPAAFRRFVDAAHARGLGVVLDAVYNHLGPDGNYLHAVTGGRFFTDRHKTPWGDAVAAEEPAVRDFVVQNALHWAEEYHVDGLRLDATHAIHDDSPVHLLRELAGRLRALPRPRLTIAEDERNDRRVVLPAAAGGLGLDGVWADDLHHQLRRLAAGDAEGYFRPFGGTAADVAETLRQGWYFDGTRPGHAGGAPPRGTAGDDLPPRAFVHCLQNHDQVGNRAHGDRLHHAVAPAVYRALSALLLLSPYTPLVWMGQEWAASTPFQYFTDHHPELGRLVTEGRRSEFAEFSAFSDPAARARIPDPQDPATFRRSTLRWDEVGAPGHGEVLALYRALLALRRAEPALRTRDRACWAVEALGDAALALRRASPAGDRLLLVVAFGAAPDVVLGARAVTRAPERGRWERVLSTEERRFGGAEPEGGGGAADALAFPGAGAVLLRAAPA